MTIEEKLAEITDSLNRMAELQFMMTIQEELALADLLHEAELALREDLEEQLEDPEEEEHELYVDEFEGVVYEIRP